MAFCQPRFGVHTCKQVDPAEVFMHEGADKPVRPDEGDPQFVGSIPKHALFGRQKIRGWTVFNVWRLNPERNDGVSVRLKDPMGSLMEGSVPSIWLYFLHPDLDIAGVADQVLSVATGRLTRQMKELERTSDHRQNFLFHHLSVLSTHFGQARTTQSDLRVKEWIDEAISRYRYGNLKLVPADWLPPLKRQRQGAEPPKPSPSSETGSKL